ncbi:MAG: long-chain fatty acid--CoA ligase, partial [Deltaproteobacteria bacterium]|nr:long-chain fatty acid--CoA ligase [Deltaproteobacteria bacterium]
MEDRIWHKSYHPEVPKSLDYEDISMPEILSRTAKKFPDRDALIFMGKKITYLELDQLVNQFANALIEIGVKQGDRVALLLPNIPQIVITYYGIWRVGAVPVPNNPLYTDRELEHQFNDSGATSLVTLDLLAPRMLALRSNTNVKQIISCHINDYLPFPLKQLYPVLKKDMYKKFKKEPDFYEFTQLMKSAPLKQPDISISLDGLALIPYTGGTTGPSKGVELSHRSVSYITQSVKAWFFDLQDSYERELAVFPFFHLAGFTAVMNVCILAGWTDILVPRPEPPAVLDMILKYKPTIIPAVPTIYVGLLALPKFKKSDLTFVKGFFSGAAPMALESINDLKDATGADLVEAYGMTESTTIITLTPWRGTLKSGSVGVPIPDTDLKIVDIDTGKKEMNVGEEGEVIFKGPQMCLGYYNKPDETANSIRDGWFYTGDIGKLDEDGYLYIVDRKKDMIIAGGFNIYPRDIDEVLFEHPKVLEACAIGVPDEYRGETVKAYIVPKPGETLTEEELNSFCRERLSAYKVPKIYEFIDELPKSAVGKILRKELRTLDAAKKEE